MLTKKVHAIKFQSIAAPSGVVANLFGPVEGKKHESGMLARSGVLNQLPRFSVDTNGNSLCIYGGPAYPLRPHLQGPFRETGLTPIQSAWNESMNEVRVSVEWIFGDIVNYFKFLDFKKKLENKFKCCWQNVCDMCPSSQCLCLLLRIHHIRLL